MTSPQAAPRISGRVDMQQLVKVSSKPAPDEPVVLASLLVMSDGQIHVEATDGVGPAEAELLILRAAARLMLRD